MQILIYDIHSVILNRIEEQAHGSYRLDIMEEKIKDENIDELTRAILKSLLKSYRREHFFFPMPLQYYLITTHKTQDTDELYLELGDGKIPRWLLYQLKIHLPYKCIVKRL